MNSATVAIATLIQVSVWRSLLATEGLMAVGAPVEPSSSADTARGVTVAAAIFEDSVVVFPSSSSPTFAMRNRIVMGALVSARVALLAYAEIVSFGFGHVSNGVTCVAHMVLCLPGAPL